MSITARGLVIGKGIIGVHMINYLGSFGTWICAETAFAESICIAANDTVPVAAPRRLVVEVTLVLANL